MKLQTLDFVQKISPDFLLFQLIMFKRCLLEVFGLESILDIILGLNLLGFQQMLSLSIKIQTMVEIFFLTCYKKHGRKIEKFFFKNLLFNHS